MSWSFYNTAGFLKTNTGRELVSTLPSSPVNGQEVFYQSSASGTGGGATNSMADVGAIWHLRYRSAAAGSYKWEAVGASPIIYSKAGTVTDTITSATYANLPTTGTAASTVAALAGDYAVTLSAKMDSNSGTANLVNLAVKIGAASTVDDNCGIVHRNDAFASQSRTTKLTFAALDTLLLQAKDNNAAGRIFEIGFSITPIRVG